MQSMAVMSVAEVQTPDGSWHTRKFENVLYVPQMMSNLISESAIVKKGYEIRTTKHGAVIYDSDGKPDSMADLIDELFYLRTRRPKKYACLTMVQWHNRLGHVNARTLKQMECSGTVKNLSFTKKTGKKLSARPAN